MRIPLIIVAVVLAILVFTNPDEAKFRDHVRKESGIAGQFGLVVTDLLSGGVKRENYLLASRFYIGGDGILPRRELAWGIAGQFIEIDQPEDAPPPRR
ncbi:MAG TPA: hypothetical protein VD994_08705 [Prosthecobacter sp.]|nr:hypothetical protein [Prosthecobacter sp.]